MDAATDFLKGRCAMPFKRKNQRTGKIVYVGQIRRGGKKKEKRFKTRKEALAWEVEMRKMSEDDWQEKIDIISLGDWAQKYLDYAKMKFAHKTYIEKSAVFRMFFREIDPALPVTKLTPARVLAYLQERMKQKSGYAANKDRKNLVAAWNWGMKYMEPLLPAPNPCLVEKMPEIRTPRYVPPEEDFWKVFEAVEDEQDRAMLLASLYLAARRGEIFRLKISDLDFENDRIRLWTKKREGGNLEYDWLPMTEELCQSLSSWLKNREIDSEYVFVCLYKTAFTKKYYGKPFTCRQQFMRRLCDKAGVKRFGFHAIRHITASQLFKKGYSVGIIQAILRHKSPSTTERYLRTLGLEQVREPLENLTGNDDGRHINLRLINSGKNISQKKPSQEPSQTIFSEDRRQKKGLIS